MVRQRSNDEAFSSTPLARTMACIITSLHSHPQIQTHLPFKTLTVIPPSKTPPSCLMQNPRFFSSIDATNPGSCSIDESLDSSEPSAWNFEENEASPIQFDGIHENVDSNVGSAWNIEENDGSLDNLEDGSDKGEILEDSSLLNEEEEKECGVEEVKVKAVEIDIEKVEKVVSILKSSSEDPIDLSLDKLELDLSEEFVAKVIEASDDVGGNLIGFVKWALESEECAKSSRVVKLLVRSVKGFRELSKKEAYMLWDLIKELGKEKWVLNAEILNELISMFWKLGKAKAGFEVFNKFDEFGCCPNVDSYYYTIQALGKRSMLDIAWSVCEKMLNSGSLPDQEKIGEIITFFCKGKKAKEAHLVYLMAKEKNISLSRSSLDFLICGLTRYDEMVPLALELLEDYPRGSYKHANKTFGSVVKGLCRVKESEKAKSLLLRMVESGPAPGNASFNYVINVLSKGGELEDAITLMKVMEGRGLRPDVYTYTVVMSGYAKGGLMDEAYKIFCEAKKRHAKLSPATYHVLTRGYCKMEEFEKAVECMKGMKEHGLQPNTDEYNKMIQSLCLKALDWRTAEKLLEEMKESGLYLKGATRSLVAAVREIEGEETQPAVA